MALLAHQQKDQAALILFSQALLLLAAVEVDQMVLLMEPTAVPVVAALELVLARQLVELETPHLLLHHKETMVEMAQILLLTVVAAVAALLLLE